MGQYANLDVSLDARGVLTVQLNRPEAENALNAEMVSDILAVLDDSRLKRDIRALVFRGRGRVFSSGSDPEWLDQMCQADPDANLRDAKTLAGMFDEMDRFPKPVVAVVQGAAVGVALGLVAAADVVIAASDASFRAPELSVGLVPSCVAPFLLAKVGQSHSRYLLLTGRTITAARAREIRLVHEIASGADALDAALEDLLADVLLNAPDALKETKLLVRRLTYHGHSILATNTLEDVAEQYAESRCSEEAREGLTAARDKRPPPWARPLRED